MRCLVVLVALALTVTAEPSRPALGVRRVRGGARPSNPQYSVDMKNLLRTYAGRASAFDVFRALEDEGARRCQERAMKLLCKSIVAGVFVGLGGALCAGVGADIGDQPFWAPGQGLARFAFGAIGYPLSITLVALTGASAFTGNLPLVGAALRANKASLIEGIRLLAVTYGGCFIGTVLMGALVAFSKLPAAGPCLAISQHKLELTALQTLLRGIGGGMCISLAITLATTAVRNNGNIMDIFIGIWVCISTYVACDFEHVLANFFFFATAIFNGNTLSNQAMLTNFLYSTLGNIIGAGALGGYVLTKVNGPDESLGEHNPPADTDPTTTSGKWDSPDDGSA